MGLIRRVFVDKNVGKEIRWVYDGRSLYVFGGQLPSDLVSPHGSENETATEIEIYGAKYQVVFKEAVTKKGREDNPAFEKALYNIVLRSVRSQVLSFFQAHIYPFWPIGYFGIEVEEDGPLRF